MWKRDYFSRIRRNLSCEALEDRRVLATFTVTTTTDFHAGSFRDAIQQANANPGPDTVVFHPSLTGAVSSLDGPAIEIIDTLIIDGGNVAGDHRIDANGQPGILNIDGSGTPDLRVSIRDLTFDGSIQDPDVPGTFPAQIKSDEADLVIDSVTITNTAQPAGFAERTSAIVATGDFFDVTIRDSFITENGGGAQLANRNAVLLDARVGGTVLIERTEISDSVSSTRGLEIYGGYLSDISILDSIITGNSEGGAVISLYGNDQSPFSGDVEIRNSIFANNDALYGPGLGLLMLDGSAELSDNVIVANEGTGLSVSTYGAANMTSVRDQVLDHDDGFGRGVLIAARQDSQVSIRHATITGNTENQANGGGGLASFVDGNAQFVLSDSLVAFNSSNGNGGGVDLSVQDSGFVEISNSTISGNYSSNNGGGIALEMTGSSQMINLQHLTVTENESVAGGVYIAGTASADTITLANSIVAQNLTGSVGDVGGDVNLNTSAYNLIGNGDGSNLADGTRGNQVGSSTSPIDAQLAPLADNGGETETHALLADSPAADAGDPNVVNPPNTDQRGAPFIRVAFGQIDIGAFETQPPDIGRGDFNSDGTLDCDDIDTLVAAIAAGSSNSLFDLNADEAVDLDDVATWLALAAAERGFSEPLLFADANLDGIVDGLDFLVWNANRFQPVAAWCSGDFNADGVVDGRDFIVWNENKFREVQGAAVSMRRGPTRNELVLMKVPNEQRDADLQSLTEHENSAIADKITRSISVRQHWTDQSPFAAYRHLRTR